MKHQSFPSILKEDIVQIFKSYWKQFIGISFLTGFLLFLLNIFLGIGLSSSVFSDTLKDKLGMYFYIKDVPGQESMIYEKVIKLKDELKNNGLEVMFSSKDDALKFLEQKIPNVVSNFEKFGIDNPIPSTLYVMFKNKDQYNSLKSVILEYKDIVLNVKDIDAGSNIKEQENRTLKFINLANFVMTLSLSIIVFIFITIFAFLGFFTKVIFQHFKEHFQLQKMLGALTTKVAKDFMTLNMIVVLTGFAICAALILVSLGAISISVYGLFGVGIGDVIATIRLPILLIILVGEVVVITGTSLIFSYFYTKSLNHIK